jgi:hypothetical protein
LRKKYILKVKAQIFIKTYSNGQEKLKKYRTFEKANLKIFSKSSFQRSHQIGRRDALLSSRSTRVLRLVPHLHHHLLVVRLAAAVLFLLKIIIKKVKKFISS